MSLNNVMFRLQSHGIFLIFLSLCFFQLDETNGQSSYIDHRCSKRLVADNGVYKQNLGKLITTFSSQASLVKFYNFTVGEIPNKVYGLFQCQEDLTLTYCSECIRDAIFHVASQCSLSGEAIVWYNECMLRYAERSIFSLPEVVPLAIQSYSYSSPTYTQSLRHLSARKFDDLIKMTAISTPHFYSTMVPLHESIECIGNAQCTRDLNEDQCMSCLKSALVELYKCCNDSGWAMLFTPSCGLQVSIYDSQELSPSPSLSPDEPLGIPYIVLLTAVLVGSMLFFCVVWPCLQWKKGLKESEDIIYGLPNGDMNEIRDLKSLQFEFSTIKAATNNFSKERKIGEGGFGEVYLGKLRNGQELAVKTVSRNSEKGILEFKNEVLLVAKLQHRNLVKLLGFCISGKEKMLIYELLSNSSLDRFLFDPLKRASLNWQERSKIINGIARGLLYLHEDSRLKVVHRDLKSSNILLDHEMNAKISDFGLAKHFTVDETQGDTARVVGTFGYMAPEYAMAGQFSVKSDVYSFGVIVLEIVSGQKNNASHQQQNGLLYRAWRLWSGDAALELADPILGNNTSNEEAKILICIHIGLLCIQEDPTNRPRMASVAAALNGESITLPLPKPPHFLTFSDGSEVTYKDHSGNSQIRNEIQVDQCKGYHSGTMSVTELCPR